ncbi:MAG: hypothetical protein ACREQY_20285 [Candidatus Binatia bacterium]
MEPPKFAPVTIPTSPAAHGCPLCGKSSALFTAVGRELPLFERVRVVGASLRPNARCPHCSALDRERLVALYLRAIGIHGRQGVAMTSPSPELRSTSPQRGGAGGRT